MSIVASDPDVPRVLLLSQFCAAHTAFHEALEK